jgi:ATP/ADP translocase
MILCMPTLTFLHVVISLVAIFSGFVVLYGLCTAQRLKGWTALFLVTTVLTSVTGFLFFAFVHFMPSHGVAVLSLVALAIAIFALYGRHLRGAWR